MPFIKYIEALTPFLKTEKVLAEDVKEGDIIILNGIVHVNKSPKRTSYPHGPQYIIFEEEILNDGYIRVSVAKTMDWITIISRKALKSHE